MDDPIASRGAHPAVNVYLARHGRTELNAAGLLRGHLDPPLDPVGRREAKDLAVAIANFGSDLVVSSPLRRALETARYFADECGLAVEIDERLIDRDYGKWAGRPAEELYAEFGSLDAAPGVEPREAVARRALAALDAAADRVEEAAVLVAHDAVNRLLIASLDADRFGSFEQIPQRTACVNFLQRSGNTWSVARVDLCPGRGSGGLEER